jgi:hypothetical protein
MNSIPPLLATYVDSEGRVKEWPGKKKRDVQLAILAYLADKFETGRTYTEREVTALLRQWHTFEDWALLRREMFELGLLNREKDGTSYWRTPNTKLF